MSKEGEVECCPPTAEKPTRPIVPHPVAAKEGHELKGVIEKLGGFDEVYVTGPDNADYAIVVVYDIFGFWETTMRGSDLLVSHLLLTSPTKVFMPDLFRGHPFPIDKDGDKEELGKFFSGTAKLDDRLPETLEFARFLKKEYNFKSISIIGYCWGGKLALLSLSNKTESPFDRGAIVHPAMITNEDGANLTRSLAFYPSQDEPKDVVTQISKDLKENKFAKSNDFHLYDTVHHGWAAARANLKDKENLKQYEDVYQRLADYFAREQK